jgi:4-alpha-glucanotransferase
VTERRDQFRLPGMRVLQFTLDGKADNPYLPDNYVPNTVVYTRTHDNHHAAGTQALAKDEDSGLLEAFSPTRIKR